MPASTEIEKLNLILLALEKDPSLAHTSAEVARLADISPIRLKQLFKTHTGITVQQFLTKAKMQKATALLKENIPIKQISLSLGYSDLASFYRSFKKHFGITPLDYRTKIKSS